MDESNWSLIEHNSKWRQPGHGYAQYSRHHRFKHAGNREGELYFVTHSHSKYCKGGGAPVDKTKQANSLLNKQ